MSRHNEKAAAPKSARKSTRKAIDRSEPPFPLYNNPNKPSFDEGWESVIELLRGRKRIAVLTGAGISVSCGIPDFRSKGTGLYATLNIQVRMIYRWTLLSVELIESIALQELGLSCAEDLFDVHTFEEDPRPFYKFARQVCFAGLVALWKVSHAVIALLSSCYKSRGRRFCPHPPERFTQAARCSGKEKETASSILTEH